VKKKIRILIHANENEFLKIKEELNKLFKNKDYEVIFEKDFIEDFEHLKKKYKEIKISSGAEAKKLLAPDIILECVMYDPKQNCLVISPKRALKYKITSIKIAQDSFGSKTILQFRLDYNIKKIKA